MKIRSRVQQSGFTLIEIVVTLAIIAVVFSIAANGFNRMNSGSNMTMQLESITSDIRSVATSALNSQTFQTESTVGWGIYFDGPNKEYTIFADLNNNKTYENNEKYKVVRMNPVLAMYLSWGHTGHPTGELYFDNVTVTPYALGTQITTEDFGVVLTDGITSVVKTVSVNSLGLVSHD